MKSIPKVAFGIVIIAILLLTALFYYWRTSLTTLVGENCGTIYEGVGAIEPSTAQTKEAAVQCLTAAFSSCAPAYLAIRAAGYEGEAYEIDYQIKPTKSGCTIKRFNWGRRVNTCQGVESIQHETESSRIHHFSMTNCTSESNFTDILQSYKVEPLM